MYVKVFHHSRCYHLMSWRACAMLHSSFCFLCLPFLLPQWSHGGVTLRKLSSWSFTSIPVGISFALKYITIIPQTFAMLISTSKIEALCLQFWGVILENYFFKCKSIVILFLHWKKVIIYNFICMQAHSHTRSLLFHCQSKLQYLTLKLGGFVCTFL